jgi:hypothetical protein
VALGSMSYVPVLKARDAEIEALLGRPSRLNVTPLFELQNAAPPTTDAATGALRRSKTTTTDASYFLDFGNKNMVAIPQSGRDGARQSRAHVAVPHGPHTTEQRPPGPYLGESI